MCDLRALSRKALLRVLERFPEEEELLGHEQKGGGVGGGGWGGVGGGAAGQGSCEAWGVNF